MYLVQLSFLLENLQIQNFFIASVLLICDNNMFLQRVDEVDEVFVEKMEQPPKLSRVEGYDSQIIPRYKEAVLAAWGAFEGFRSNKIDLQSLNVKSRPISQVFSILHVVELSAPNRS